MAMQQNTDHIQTTHIGSLPRPHKLLDILKAKYGRQPYDEAELNSTLTQAVAECVRNQVECGIENRNRRRIFQTRFLYLHPRAVRRV